MKSQAATLTALTIPQAAVVLVAVVPLSAFAQPGPWQVEAVAGLSVTDLPADEEPAFGFRVVRDTGARWSFEGQVLRVSADREQEFAIIATDPPRPTAITHMRFDFEAIAVDLSARLRLLPEDSPVQLQLLAGPGWAFVDAELRFRPLTGPDFRFRRGSFLDDSLTAHIGLALGYDFTERWYVRFDARDRWWDKRGGSDDFDQEYTVGVGYRF